MTKKLSPELLVQRCIDAHPEHNHDFHPENIINTETRCNLYKCITHNCEITTSPDQYCNQKGGGCDECIIWESTSVNGKYLKNLIKSKILNDYHYKIIDIIYEKLKGSGNNKSRKSHCDKTKSITLEDLVDSLIKNDWKCYYSKQQFDCDIKCLCPSIERINSKDTYNKDNCVIVLELINNMKNGYCLIEFKRAIKSLSTGKIEDNLDYLPEDTHIGGPKSKKNLKSWKPPHLDRPIKMFASQVYIYECLDSIDEYKSNIEIRELIKAKTNIEYQKEVIHNALNNFHKNGYINKIVNVIHHKWKLKTREEIISLHNNLKIPCGSCNKEYALDQYRHRDARGAKTKSLECNIIHTICTECNTKSTNKCTNKNPKSFILRQISDRIKNKCGGDINKDNIDKIITPVCAISGVPILYGKGTNLFNQASPDRIDNKKGYNINNVRIICLMLNFAKNDYEITDEALMNYIKFVNININNF